MVDLLDPDEVDRLARSAVADLGHIDVLVNNAGIPMRRHITRLDAETVRSTMAINYLSPVQLTLASAATPARATGGPHRQRVVRGGDAQLSG